MAASGSYGFNFGKRRIIDSLEELSLLFSVKQEYISFFEYSNSCVSSDISYDNPRVDISFCKFSLSSKTREVAAVDKSLGYCNSCVSSGDRHLFKTLNTKTNYKIFFV